MTLFHFLFLLLLGTNVLSMAPLPSSASNIASPSDSVDVVEDFLPGNSHMDDIASVDDTVHYKDDATPDIWIGKRSFPPSDSIPELINWAIVCNYSQPLIPPMIFRSTLAWCRQVMTCNRHGDLVPAMYAGPSAIEQSSWTWCRNSCHCYEVDIPAVHYSASFGCPNPTGGWVHGAIGSPSKRDGESASDPDTDKFLEGLVMDENDAVTNTDNTTISGNTTKSWPEETLAEIQGVKLGYDPTDPTWQNPIYMLTSCTLYPAMDAHGLILAMAKMMDWCGCENLLNTEGQSYGGMAVYDPDTNVRVWACSVGPNTRCDNTTDWYYALGNVTYQCGQGNAGYFYDASRQMAWGFDSYDHFTFCQDVRWVTYIPSTKKEED